MGGVPTRFLELCTYYFATHRSFHRSFKDPAFRYPPPSLCTNHRISLVTKCPPLPHAAITVGSGLEFHICSRKKANLSEHSLISRLTLTVFGGVTPRPPLPHTHTTTSRTGGKKKRRRYLSSQSHPSTSFNSFISLILKHQICCSNSPPFNSSLHNVGYLFRYRETLVQGRPRGRW